ncbi:uncharacterized protein [Apostichopus japonicus]|uniref:uncharacterized protein isoform X2 n=1 Tax=Stichopus japonicus TaxID=307972 RepID=UPI003AB57BAC
MNALDEIQLKVTSLTKEKGELHSESERLSTLVDSLNGRVRIMTKQLKQEQMINDGFRDFQEEESTVFGQPASSKMLLSHLLIISLVGVTINGQACPITSKAGATTTKAGINNNGACSSMSIIDGSLTNCRAIYTAGCMMSGIYKITPNDWTEGPFEAYCDMETLYDMESNLCTQRGWTVFQRRVNGSVDFNRNWTSYKEGFGQLDHEFWLGNEKLHYLTKEPGTYRLRIDLVSNSGTSYHACYQKFIIKEEGEKYELHASRFFGTNSLSDGLSDQNGKAFSTSDRDITESTNTCADFKLGGWWHEACNGDDTNLNGVYGSNQDSTSIYWNGLPNGESIISSEMKNALDEIQLKVTSLTKEKGELHSESERLSTLVDSLNGRVRNMTEQVKQEQMINDGFRDFQEEESTVFGQPASSKMLLSHLLIISLVGVTIKGQVRRTFTCRRNSEAGATTSKAEAHTTNVGATTTKAGTTTTKAGTNTTKAGTTTTKDGATTTKAGATTTTPGATTTKAGTPTKAGATTTKAGASTNKAGATTTKAGATTTKAEAITTKAGATTTKAGTPTNKAGAATTKAGATTTKTGTTTTKAGTITTKDGATTTKAEAPTTTPGATTTTPGATTTNAGTPTNNVGATTTNVGATTTKARTTTTKDSATTAKAEAPTTTPGATTTKAGTPTTTPGATTTKAGTPTNKDGATTTKAGATTTKAGATTTKAGATTTKAGTITTKAGAITTKAGATTTKAGTPTNKAGATTTKAGATTNAGATTTKAGVTTNKAGMNKARACSSMSIIDGGLKDCRAIYIAGCRESGIYNITPNGWTEAPFEAYCDMKNLTDRNWCRGHGWTVFQRRVNGSVNFNRNWTSYKEGFGQMNHEFWLGNEKLHYLTKNDRKQRLRIDIECNKGISYHVCYMKFHIKKEGENYKLHASGFHGTNSLRGGLSDQNGKAFSTYDRDNTESNNDCADVKQGGWWHEACNGGYTNLNGVYGSNQDSTSIYWKGLPKGESIISSEMKIRHCINCN